jgi:glutathione S-transferase
MADLTLYNYELDESAYKIRLLASFLGLDIKLRGVDMFPGGEHRTPEFLALSPDGSLPVIKDGDFILSGAEACLSYLANTYHPGRDWFPLEARTFAEIQYWLVFAALRLQPAITARRHALFDVPADNDAVTGSARQALRLMDDHMIRRGFGGKAWFAGDAASIADIALFPSFALSRDFGVDHDEYPALRKWGRRLRSLPGFRSMPGIPDYH